MHKKLITTLVTTATIVLATNEKADPTRKSVTSSEKLYDD